MANHFEIPPNQKVTKFICFLYVIIRRMWLAPKVIFSNQVENKISAIITKPSKMLERTPYDNAINIIIVTFSTFLSKWWRV